LARRRLPRGQDPEASGTLVELGCVPFFRAFKEDADQETRPSVQAILDALLKVQVKPSPAVTPNTSPPRVTGPAAATPHAPARARSVPAPDLALCARIAQYCRTSATDGCRFPLVSLCAEDEVLLSDLTVRLYRQVPREAVDACAELEHSVVRDFPAEVVLQRPALFQALVSLVQTPNHINDLTVDLAAISTMTGLVRSFRRSLGAYASANLTAAWRFSNSEADLDKVLDHLSSGRQGGAATKPAYPAVPHSSSGADGEGLSLSQACRCIVGEVLPLLRDGRRVVPIYQLLREVLPLLSASSPRSAQAASSHEVDTRMVSQYVHSIAKVIDFHGPSACSDPVISHVVMIAVALLELAPPDIALSEKSWPHSTLVLMGDLMLNESFCNAHPTFRSRVLPYLTLLQPPAARRYSVALSVRQQLDCCVALFSRRQTTFSLADLTAVVEASSALRYRCDAALVANFVLACADLSSSKDVDQLQLEEIRTVMLGALRSPVTALRGHTYAALHQMLKVHNKGSRRDTALHALVFHPVFMRQLLAFGLHDDHLGTIPADMLREIMSLCGPGELCELVAPSMVAVQAAVGVAGSGAAASALLDTVQPQLAPLARLKSNVSMLFHKEAWMRSQAATTLRSDYPTIVPPDEDASLLDPFYFDGYCLASDPSLPTESTVRTLFDESEICKVIDVFNQSVLTSQLRRSAAEQLVCLCQDSHACSVVYHHEVWVAIWRELSTADSTLQAVCLRLIMMVVERLAAACSALRSDEQKLQELLAFAFQSELNVRALASRIFSLVLLRSDILTPEHGDQTELNLAECTKLSVPRFVQQNFLFSFPVESSSPSEQSTNMASPDSGITQWLEATSKDNFDTNDQVVSVALAGFDKASSLLESLSHLEQLHQLCSVSDAATEAVLRSDWIPCFVRYLQAVPSSLADYQIVSKVLQLVSVMLQERSLDEEDLQPLRTCIEHLVGLLDGLTDVLNSSYGDDEPSVGWLHSDLRSQTAEQSEGQYAATVQCFREAVLCFLADFILCEQWSSPGSPTTAALLVDGSTFLTLVCSPRFPGTGPLALGVRSAALRCLLLVLRSANGCKNATQVNACLDFCRSVVSAAGLAPARYIDDQLYRVAMDGAGQCLHMLQGSASVIAEDFIASTLEIVGTRNTATRSAALVLLKDIASSAAQTEHLKTEWENVVSFFGLGDRMVSIAVDADERFEVRGALPFHSVFSHILEQTKIN